MAFDRIVLPSQTVIPLGIALGHIVLCLYVLFRRQLDDKINRLFIAYLLLTILWNVNLVIAVANVSTLLPSFGWMQLGPYDLIILSVVYWAFARTFLYLPSVRWGWLLGLGGLLVAIGMNFVPLDVLFGVNPWIRNNRPGFIFGIAWWALFMVLTAMTIRLQLSRTQSPAHKNRIQYLFIATILLGFGQGAYMTLWEPLWAIGLIITWLGNVLLTYIVVTEALIDLRTGARRTVRFLVVAAMTMSIYVAGIYLVQILLGDFLASTILGRYLDPTLLVAAVTAVLLTVVYPPISRVSQRLTNRLLFGQHYDYQMVIQQYGRAISNILELSYLAKAALTQIDQALVIKKGALFILDSENGDRLQLRIFPVLGNNDLPPTILLHRDSAITARLIGERQALSQYTVDLSPQFRGVPADDLQTLKQVEFEWFVPILKQEKLLGLFALGPKNSSQPYSGRDLRLLETLADQTALALENATLFDRVQRNLVEITGMKNLMDNVFNSIDNGVITIDNHHTITFINQAAGAILGVPPDCCVGRVYDKVLPSLPGTILVKLMQRVMGKGEHFAGYELILELPQRGRVNLRVSLTPLKDTQNRPQGVTIVMDDLTETKRLQAVHNMFRRYVSPAVVDRLPSNPADLKLGGVRQMVTILFADIRGFTSFSEHMAPEVLVDSLNQYLSMAATSILMFEGTLDKFVGDAVMGIFNAPLKQEDHVLRAVRAAATMQRAITDYHHNLGQQRQLSFGVGIHMGEVVVGNVGMSDRMDYTAIGDAVNVAKRLQENAPGGKVLISEAIYNAVKHLVDAEFYEEMIVRGREQPVNTYNLRWV